MELREGYKQTEVGVIPEDWEATTIGENTRWSSGGTPNRKRADYWEGSIPWISGSTLKTLEISTSDQFLTSEGVAAGSNMAPVNATLLLVRGSALHKYIRAGLVVSPVSFNQDVKSLVPIGSVLPKYLTFFIKGMESDLLKLVSSAGNSAGVLDTELVKNFKFLKPTKTEQTAIANALSDADALIQSLTRLIAKKRQIKQGAMQTLLNPYENGRLKAGWVVKKLGVISKIGRGRVISHKEINLAIEGKYPVYSSQTTNNGVMGYIDTYDFDGEYVTWTTDGENAGKVFCRSGKFNCTNVCGTIKLSEGDIVFVSLLLGTITPKHVSRNLANPKLMNDPVKKIDLPIPPKAEQTRIATILSDMDADIAALETKLTKAQQIKQGMMQNLLTGRIRLVTPQQVNH